MFGNRCSDKPSLNLMAVGRARGRGHPRPYGRLLHELALSAGGWLFLGLYYSWRGAYATRALIANL